MINLPGGAGSSEHCRSDFPTTVSIQSIRRSRVTGPSKIDEMSRLSRVATLSDEMVEGKRSRGNFFSLFFDMRLCMKNAKLPVNWSSGHQADEIF